MKFIIVLIIVMTGILIYANSFNNEFIFDDIDHVVKNTVIRSLKNIAQVFKHHLTHFAEVGEGKFYRPITTFAFMLDYSLWNLNPFGYHLTNTLLHILVSILVFYVMCLVTRSTPPSAIISILYLVHPIHTEAVTYISGRADSISMVFLLLMIIFQHNYWLKDTRYKSAYYLLTLLSFSLALLSKESAVIFPFLLMFHEYCLRTREKYQGLVNKSILYYLPFFVLMGMWFFFKNSVVSTEIMVKDIPSLSTRLTTVPRLIFNYVRLSLFPLNLHMGYKPAFPKSLFQSGYFGPFVFTLCFLYLFRYIWRRGQNDINYRIMFFGLGWFILALFPYLNIIFPLNAVFAEHWLYLPEMGFLLFLIYFIFYYFREKKIMRICIAFFSITAIAVYSYLTIRQNSIWKNPITFYTYTIKHSPSNAKAYNNLAVEYIVREDYPKAKGLLKHALKIEPSYDTAKDNLRKLELQLRRKGHEEK